MPAVAAVAFFENSKSMSSNVRQKRRARTRIKARSSPEQVADILREHGVIAVIMFLGFVMRLFLADANSYWLDELISVVIYGISNPTVVDAIGNLTQSTHPPLYQFILYYWMALFGDSEVATRSLSNLYVTGATLCLYLLTLRLYGWSVAIATTLIFSLMHMPLYYALETRSYAQTLFLASLSSLLLFNFLRALPERLLWRALLRDWRLDALVAANLALLLTHYYNVFFLGAQGIFLLAFLLLRSERGHVFATVLKGVAVGAAPLILLLLIWGPVMVDTYGKYDSRFLADVPAKTPWSMFFDMVVQPNLALPATVLAVMGLVLLPRLARSGRDIYRGNGKLCAYADYYFLMAVFMPCVLAYLLFLVAEHERYSSRYFIFCTPPLGVLMALSIEEIVCLLGGFASGFSLAKYRNLALPVVMLVAIFAVLPGGYLAATSRKSDWSGIAAQIVNFAASKPDKSLIIYETTWRKYPTLDYYLSRFSKKLRVQGFITPGQERREDFMFEAQTEEIGRHDYLVLAFPHHRLGHFPRALKRLGELYQVHFRLLDKAGRGMIVYKIAH